MSARNASFGSNPNNCSSSNSSQNTSLYETPTNSPLNRSLIESTGLEYSQTEGTDRTSVLSDAIESIDLLDSRQSYDSVVNRSVRSTPISVETISTLKDQRFGTNSQIFTNDFGQQTNYERIRLRTNMSCSHNSVDDRHRLLSKYMAELESEQMSIISIEQQIHSMSLRCKTIRQNIVSKTNAIYSLINDILIPKEMIDKQTQIQSFNESNDGQVLNNLENIESFRSRKDLISFSRNDSKQKFKTKTKQSFPEITPNLKASLHRLPALVKGYLVRRLMKTNKVINLIKTIRDTTQLLLSYKNNKEITIEDIKFHERLIIQLEKGCHTFYDILINYPKSDQMALIAQSRQHLIQLRFRTGSALSTSTRHSSGLRIDPKLSETISGAMTGISSATKKRLKVKTDKNQTIGSIYKISETGSESAVKKMAPNNQFSKDSQIPSPSMIPSLDQSSRSQGLRRSQRNVSKTKLNIFKRKP